MNKTSPIVFTAVAIVVPLMIAPPAAADPHCMAKSNDDSASCSFDCPDEQHQMELSVAANDKDARVSGQMMCGVSIVCTETYHCGARGIGGPDPQGGSCAGSVDELLDDGITIHCSTSACVPPGTAPLFQRAYGSGLISFACGDGLSASTTSSTTIHISGRAAVAEVCEGNVCTPVTPLCLVGKGIACGVGGGEERLLALLEA